MNIIENEIPYLVEAKICGYTDNSNQSKSMSISYQFMNSVHVSCIDKKELLISQIQACERLLKYAKIDSGDNLVLGEEMTRLRLALDLVDYRN